MDKQLPAVTLAAMRSALRRQRGAKQPGDGILYVLPSSDESPALHSAGFSSDACIIDVLVRALHRMHKSEHTSMKCNPRMTDIAEESNQILSVNDYLM